MSGEDNVSILADWGNSSGRLFCVSGLGPRPIILDRKRIAGAKDLTDCASAFSEAIADWQKIYAISEAWLCGAVTSNVGWLTTGYANAPARPGDIGIRPLVIENDLTCHFLEGTSLAKNGEGYFDTVRGEDMQSFGWSALTGLKSGMLCLPGTHTKWIRMKEGAITGISTGVTGETFEVLDRHSILTRGGRNETGSDAVFRSGLDVMRQTPRPPLTHMLMSVRTLQLSGELSAGEARDYLSGLLIGEDCSPRIGNMDDTIHIIGDGPSVSKYASALSHFGQSVERHDGEACVIAGLQMLRARTASP